MISIRYAILLSVIVFVYSDISVAAVDCSLIQDKDLTNERQLKRADYLLKRGKVHQLCSFYVAWALQNEPDKARPYIEPIKNILRRREPFYYKAIYLKLLLLELSPEEIRRDLRKLDSAAPRLAQKVKIKGLEVFKKDLERLRNEPFNTTIATGSPWVENTAEKRQADDIMAWVAEISSLNTESTVTEENSRKIVGLFDQLKNAGAKIETHEILAAHRDYVKYYELMAKAEDKREEFSVRLNSAKQAADMEKSYEVTGENAKAAILYEGLKLEAEVNNLKTTLTQLVKQLKNNNRIPSELNLSEVKKYWGSEKSVAEKLDDEDDKGFLELLKLYDDCKTTKLENSCEAIVERLGNEYDHLSQSQLKLFQDEAKTVLQEKTKLIADQIEAIIRNDDSKYAKVDVAYREANELIEAKQNALNKDMPRRYEEIKEKVKKLNTLKDELSLDDKDWTKIYKLTSSLGIANNFDELRSAYDCKSDQEAIKEATGAIEKYEIQAAIKSCHDTLNWLKCTNGIKSTRLKLIEAVAKKIVNNAVTRLGTESADEVEGVIDQTIEYLGILQLDEIDDYPWLPLVGNKKNNCKAEGPLDMSVSDAKRFFEGLKSLHDKRQNKAQNLADIEGMLAQYPKVKQLIKVDLDVKNSLAKAVSKPDSETTNIPTPPKATNENSQIKDAPAYIPSVTNTSKECWKWETSAFRYMLAYNDRLRTDYSQFFQGTKYPYFVAGMKVWKGKATPTDYQAQPISHKLAKAVEVLRNGIDDPNAGQEADFDAFEKSIRETLTGEEIEADRIKAESTRGSKLNRARFVRAFFLGLWHLERQEYQDSKKLIKDAYNKYKYNAPMNNFSKQLIESAIADLERRLKKVD